MTFMLLGGISLVTRSIAQSGTAMSFLDINKVSAPILNRGDMFWDLQMRGYEVPKGSGKAVFMGQALWLGGVTNGTLRIAAQTYRQNGSDYWPGPLSTGTATTTAATQQQYDRIWKINKSAIDEFKQMWSDPNYSIPAEILSWPAHGDVSKGQAANLAPFVNVGGDPQRYEPQAGDYPLIKGDQMLYWIFNDKGGLHTETQGAPLGVEVHGSAYAFNCDRIGDNDSNAVLNYTTFYHFEVFNRGNELIDSFKVGLWSDIDIGNYADDYIGCNPKKNYAFGINGDNMDESEFGYGANPPAVATVLLGGLNTPTGRSGLTNYQYYNNDFSMIGNPAQAAHYWGYMNSTWKDGSHVTYGGNGKGGSDPSTFMYPGPDDPSGRPVWTEASVGNVPGDRRGLITTGTVTLPPGGSNEVDYAVVYTRLSSVPGTWPDALLSRLDEDVTRVQRWYTQHNFPACAPVSTGITKQEGAQPTVSLYPNPAHQSLTVQYQPVSSQAVYEVFDLTGRSVLGGVLQHSKSIDVRVLNEGLYILRITDGGIHHSSRFVKE